MGIELHLGYRLSCRITTLWTVSPIYHIVLYCVPYTIYFLMNYAMNLGDAWKIGCCREQRDYFQLCYESFIIHVIRHILLFSLLPHSDMSTHETSLTHTFLRNMSKVICPKRHFYFCGNLKSYSKLRSSVLSFLNKKCT